MKKIKHLAEIKIKELKMGLFGKKQKVKVYTIKDDKTKAGLILPPADPVAKILVKTIKKVDELVDEVNKLKK